jgi:hypothetical protein
MIKVIIIYIAYNYNTKIFKQICNVIKLVPKKFEESDSKEFEESSSEMFEGSSTKGFKGILNKLKY